VKNLLLTLGIVAAACALSFGVFYAMSREPAEVQRALRDGDALAWLRAEFQLNDAQFAAIKQLHENYREACAVHCAAIMDAEKRGAPAAEVAALEKTCVDAMTVHFKRVAALMPAGQGERYLAIVLPRVADFDHRGAPNVQVKS
jgi:urease gamma subunit